MNIKLVALFMLSTTLLLHLECASSAPQPQPCALEKSCAKVQESDATCIYDDVNGCIRKFPSKCHLDIAACHERKNYTDFSEVYCSMETYLCETEYERWTIFFGYEK